MTRRAAILVVLFTAGCGSPSTGVQTSLPSSLSTVPIESAATTTTDAGPVDIPGRSISWEPGVYTTDRFLVPMSFAVDVSGWRSFGVEAEWFEVALVEPGDNTIAVSLVIVAYRPGDGVDELVAAITSIEGVSALSEPTPEVVGGFDAMVVDVEGTPDPTFASGGGRECSEPGGTARFFFDGAGYQLFTKGINAFGIPACYRSRVWVVDVDGSTITMIGTVDETDDFDRLMPDVEHLLDGLQFELSP